VLYSKQASTPPFSPPANSIVRIYKIERQRQKEKRKRVLKARSLRVKTEKEKKNIVGSSNIKRQQKERRINGT
jgi:hypothetical protein